MDTDYIDNKIKELADYQPEVQPDWSGFYSKNTDALQQMANVSQKTNLSGILKTAIFRNTVIVVSLIGIFITAYVLYNQPVSSGNGEQHPAPVQETVPVPKAIEPSTIQNPKESGAERHEKQLADPLKNGQSTSGAKSVKPENSAPATEKSASTVKSDSTPVSPVVIRKTVVKVDTVRKVTPVKKDF